MAGCSDCKKINAKNNALSLTIRTGFVNCHIMDEDVGGITIKKSFLNNLYYKHFDRNLPRACHSLSNQDFSRIRAALAEDRSANFWRRT